jgi:hypothetical protein
MYDFITRTGSHPSSFIHRRSSLGGKWPKDALKDYLGVQERLRLGCPDPEETSYPTGKPVSGWRVRASVAEPSTFGSHTPEWLGRPEYSGYPHTLADPSPKNNEDSRMLFGQSQNRDHGAANRLSYRKKGARSLDRILAGRPSFFLARGIQIVLVLLVLTCAAFSFLPTLVPFGVSLILITWGISVLLDVLVRGESFQDPRLATLILLGGIFVLIVAIVGVIE